MRLKDLARWNQTEKDWLRLLEHDPTGCFAAVIDGNIVATTTTTVYAQKLAWVGMVLVDPEYRRRGIATRMVTEALSYLRARGVPEVKLDATPEGQPLYESLGFRYELLIERWSGTASPTSVAGVTQMESSDQARVLDFDREAFGADRSKLLQSLFEDGSVPPLVSMTLDGRLLGYALARNGTSASYLGPIGAADIPTASALLDGLFSRLNGQKVYIDVNTTFAGFEMELNRRGLTKERDLIRMSYGTRSGAGTSSSVFAIAGPEVG
jgi:predicted GNAT family acetyltransferase